MTEMSNTTWKFDPGRIVIARVAAARLKQADVLSAFWRHVTGDWGELDEPSWQENDLALEKGDRLFSLYHAKDGTEIWVITEHDRSVTTILLPEEN